MKWTTANIKRPDYTQSHEIYVGTHTGSFKKLEPYSENPHSQQNLVDIGSLEKGSTITVLSYGNILETEILIGRLNKNAVKYNTLTSEVEDSLELADSPVGMCNIDGLMVAGLSNGEVHIFNGETPSVVKAGDHMSRMRYFQGKLATGGKGRQNNLKIFDLQTKRQIFCTKNLPNDFLNLEVPTWDSDVAFLSANCVSTCSRYGYVRVYDTRAQRRPVQIFASEDHSFTCLVAREPFLYSGTTMGALKAFDSRNMKNFLHTYKGFTGSLSDLAVDSTGSFLVSGCLDRYIRVHKADTCEMMYQCYVKSKVTRVLVRDSSKVIYGGEAADEEALTETNKFEDKRDDEYEALFENMPTVSDSEKCDVVEISLKRKTKKQSNLNKKKMKTIKK